MKMDIYKDISQMPVVVSWPLLQNTHKPLALLLQEDNAAERRPIMTVVNTSYVGVFYSSRLVFVFKNVV